MTDVAVIDRAKPVSLIGKIAERYSVEPAKLADTLKATAFKTEKPVTNEQLMALLIVADQYRLNPFTRELFAFPDKGGGIVPVVSVDGWARIVNEHPQFDGMDFQYLHDSKGNLSAITCVMYRKDRGHPISITEFMAECKRGTAPWQSHPSRMLRHKSMIQAARIAFGFAGIFDEDEAHRIVQAQVIDEAQQKPVTRMRQALAAPQAPAAVIASPPAPVPVVQVPGRTLAAYILDINDATDAETAALVLDEARSALSEEHLAHLARVYHTRFTTEEEKEPTQ